MSSAVIPLPSVAPAKSPKKRARSQKKTGPTVSDLILKAVTTNSGRGGVSLAALKKTLKAGGYDVVKNRARIVTALKRLVTNKSLVQTKGTGASGSFKLNKNAPKPRKKVVKKKKPKAKKVKRTRAKKVGGTPAKKSPKKKRKAKSPKKAKRPAAAKKPRKPKSPKKTKRKAAKSTRSRAAAKK